jgi:hypothetical protein
MKLLFIPLGLVAMIALNSLQRETKHIQSTAILQNTPAEN